MCVCVAAECRHANEAIFSLSTIPYCLFLSQKSSNGRSCIAGSSCRKLHRQCGQLAGCEVEERSLLPYWTTAVKTPQHHIRHRQSANTTHHQQYVFSHPPPASGVLQLHPPPLSCLGSCICQCRGQAAHRRPGRGLAWQQSQSCPRAEQWSGCHHW